ncbi:hypothetical protein [Pseudomonas sp. EA_35y_Pfl2_R5]|uniref:hypothetical protein n=1 Tax=Pseudomonas sp. EA_35y_Pfl2_R5 TaxID=3088690 RepID=UPI0030DB323F
MTKSDASIANRLFLAVAVIFFGSLLWLIALDTVMEFFDVFITGKLWAGFVLGSAVVTDRIYKFIAKRKAGANNVQNT